MSTETEQKQPYAKCNDCDATAADRDEMNEHLDGTLEEAKKTTPGLSGYRGHSMRVVNPTREEAEQARQRGLVSRAVEDALDTAVERLDDDVYRGYITKEQVREHLAYFPDFAEAWDEYQEGEGQ